MKFILLFFFILCAFCDDTEENVCSALKEKQSCLTKKLQSEDYHCCMISEKNKENQDGTCKYTAKYLSIYYKDEKTKVLSREILGQDQKGINDDTDNDNTILKYECEDGEFEYNNSYFQYSEKDKEVLASKKHCLYDMFGEKEKISDEVCQKRILTQTAIDAGYKCGYYDMKFFGENGEDKTLQLCYFISKDDITSGKLNPVILHQMDEFVTSIYKKSSATYTIKMSSGKDISGTYNSKDGKLVNKSDIIKISEYLMILFLILF